VNSLAEIVGKFRGKRIVVIGDIIADQFIYGEISRVSREAPVFILRHEHTETTPGGAGNCAANLAALGATVRLVSVVCDDEPGRLVCDRLRSAGVNCKDVIVSDGRETTNKVRVLAGQIHSTRQQVIRIDYDSQPPIDATARAQLSGSMTNQVDVCDAVIISDYNYGVADPEMNAALKQAANAVKVPVIVDSRFRLSDFSGFTSATPNEDELAHLLGREARHVFELEQAAEKLREQLGYQALLVTRGAHGMMLVEKNTTPLHIDAVGAHQPVDVTGAGDTVIATYTLALACGASFSKASRLANIAGGLVVMKRGTATVTPDELLSNIDQL
jgi:D-glycero-beta-D-manno-heptose-7-phosphate kinase